MRFISGIRGFLPLAVLLAGICPLNVQAIWVTQRIPLNQGWNAVQVRVNPYDYGCDRVFGGGGIDQVTWWNRDRRDDGTGTTTADTFAWYAKSPEPNTFGAVMGGEAYLVHAVVATNLIIKGTPANVKGKLFLGESNLVGANLPFESCDVSPTDYFGSFGSLESSAYWSVKAADATNIKMATKFTSASQAIWLETTGSGSATYTGPLEVSVDTSDKIIGWNVSSAARTITIRNMSKQARLVTVGLKESEAVPAGQGVNAGLVQLKSEFIDWSQGYARRLYKALAFPIVTNLASGATYTLRIRPNLEAMPATDAGDYLGILTVTDAGTQIAGEAEKRTDGVCYYHWGVKSAGGLAASKEPSGLWVGSVALTGVNRAQMLTSAKSEWDAEKIQETTQAFQFRLILHAGNDGSVKLMKQAFVGSTEDDNALAAVIADKATAKTYRSKYPSAKIRRVSSANFPFMEPQAFDGSANFLKDGGEMTVSFTQFYDAKDNPFLHAFHPNHDNLVFNNGAPKKKGDGATGTGDYESWNVTRAVKLTFAGTDPTGAAGDDWNKTVCGGTYRETITGLNKTPIIVEGAFRLYKSLDTPGIQSGGVAR